MRERIVTQSGQNVQVRSNDHEGPEENDALDCAKIIQDKQSLPLFYPTIILWVESPRVIFTAMIQKPPIRAIYRQLVYL